MWRCEPGCLMILVTMVKTIGFRSRSSRRSSSSRFAMSSLYLFVPWKRPFLTCGSRSLTPRDSQPSSLPPTRHVLASLVRLVRADPFSESDLRISPSYLADSRRRFADRLGTLTASRIRSWACEKQHSTACWSPYVFHRWEQKVT
jgi:hypothetical protein